MSLPSTPKGTPEVQDTTEPVASVIEADVAVVAGGADRPHSASEHRDPSVSPEPLTRPGTALGGIESSPRPSTAKASAEPPVQRKDSARHPIIINKRPATARQPAAAQRLEMEKRERLRGPPLPKEVEALRRMSARDRVEYGYRMLREANFSRGSAAFASNLPRDPYDLHEERIVTQQHACRKRMEEERHKKLVAQYGLTTQRGRSADRCDSRMPNGDERQKRSSSWARDTTPRGNYMFNWTSMPQCIPRSYIDPTPGPGAYTPILHYVGGTHV
jgi:hypothetical protein